MARKKSIDDQIRQEIKRQGLSSYRIAKVTGANESTIGRFVNAGKGLRSDTLNSICKMLGLELIHTDELRELRKIKRAGS